MATKIRNVELLTLARSDAGTPVLGHVGIGIDANLIQDVEMALSRVSSAAQFNLALNVEGGTTDTSHFGGIAFTQGVGADTVMASIKGVNTTADGYVDLSFNTRSVTNVLYIKADGKVGIKKIPTTYALEVDGDVQATNFRGAFIGNLTGNVTGTVSTLSNHDTDGLSEGSSNLYFTNERAQDAIGTMLSGNTETLITVTYDDTNNEIDFVVDNDLSNYSNTSSAFITLSSISVTDSGGDGSLAYNNSTGVITYTGPSASDVRAHFSAGTGIGISSGEISIGQAVATGSNVVFNQVTAALVGNASTATALETTRAITIGPDQATSQHDRAGDIAKLSQNFDGSAAIQINSKLEDHLYGTDGKTRTITKSTGVNIAAEASNDDVIIIGTDLQCPQLKINKQGLIVGFKEVAITGGTGSGSGISSIAVNTHGQLFVNSNLETQTISLASSANTLNLYLKEEFAASAIVSGTLGADRIPFLSTGKITSGTFASARIPDLAASKITSGTFDAALIPELSAAKITSGTLAVARLTGTYGISITGNAATSTSTTNAVNATNAANVAIAANATDSTRFLTFVTGSSGNLPLLVDTDITYNPSSNTLTVASINATSSASLKDVTLADKTTTSAVEKVIGKISGSDVLYEFNGPQLLTFVGVNTVFTGSGPYAINITGSAASATTAASCTGNSATSTKTNGINTTSNGVVTTTGGNGTVSVVSQAPDSAKLGGLLLVEGVNYAQRVSHVPFIDSGGVMEVGRIIDLVHQNSNEDYDVRLNCESDNSLKIEGAAVTIADGGLTCGDIIADSIDLTEATASIKAREYRPKGSSVENYGYNPSAGGSTVIDEFYGGSYSINKDGYFAAFNNFYLAKDTRIGNYANSNIGAVHKIDVYELTQVDGNLFSDIRVKKNIKALDVGLNFVRLLQPTSYELANATTPRKKYGAIAQDIEGVVEDLGLENSSLVSIDDFHEDSEEENENKPKKYNPTQIMWILFNAVKQLDTEVQELKKQLEEK